MNEKMMTVKEYADQQHVSRQSVNSKINRHKEELKNHICTENGKKVLDRFAQEFLKPTKGNVLLINKNADLEKSLAIEKSESKQNKALAESQENMAKSLDYELKIKNKVFQDYVGIMKEMEKCIIEQNAVIAQKDERIAELTAKAAAFENFAERLDKLFALFEDNANIGIVQKVASGLFGKK